MTAKVRAVCALAVAVASVVVILQGTTMRERQSLMLERNSAPDAQHQPATQNKNVVLDEIVRKELELRQVEDMENTIRRGLTYSPNPSPWNKPATGTGVRSADTLYPCCPSLLPHDPARSTPNPPAHQTPAAPPSD